jgi:peptide/nickel transport system ATP-binding protein
MPGLPIPNSPIVREPAAKEPILSVQDLKVHFTTQNGVGKAVDGVWFDLFKGETLGLVGESGCGKSITALSVIGLNPKPASRIIDGRILFAGEDLVNKPESELRKYRGKRIGMILQDPLTALNPVFTIGNQLAEPLRIHQKMAGTALKDRMLELLRLLHVPAGDRRIHDYPHQLSGGMRQRVVGAIALSCNPELLIADEPTTSLDVTIQAAYLALLKQIQQEQGLAILFITHDFSVVASICDRVAVMYAGRIVETASTWQLFNNPVHPYTKALLESIPDVRVSNKRLSSIEGSPPSIYNVPHGCPFAPRCPQVMPKCIEQFPPSFDVEPGHNSSCWLAS